MAIGDDAIRDAFFFFAELADAMGNQGLPQHVWDTPCFTYLLTKKQFNQMKVVCQRSGCDLPPELDTTFS